METNSLETVKRLLSEGRITQDVAEEIFPELKENEDERIRKIMLQELKSSEDSIILTPQKRKRWIAWLEKQTNGLIWHKVKSGEYVLEPTLIIKKNGEYELVKDAFLSLVDAEYALPLSCIKKQGSQNLANSAKTCKDEPKFKVGDWIVRDSDGLIMSIKSVKDGIYYFHQGGNLFVKDVDECYHLWTIQDAKDGDILVMTKDDAPFIFKGFLDRFHPGCPVAYGGIVPEGIFDISSGDGWWDSGKMLPANKEQRDLLFQKMKEAGYEWDAEKKELKKIEQNPAWSKDEKPLLEKFKQAVYDCAWGKVTCKAEGETKEEYANRFAERFLLIVRDWADDYIEYTIQQKLRKSYDEGKEDAIKENSPAWSKDDEYYYGIIQHILNNECVGKADKKNAINWFKLLKKRYTWKPSNEQLEALEHSLGDYHITVFEDRHEILTSLYQDIKKLKGK